MSTSELSGTWTYRSFNPTYVTGNETPQEDPLILTEAAFNLQETSTTLQGTYESGGVLDLNGTVLEDERVSFEIGGIGRPGTNTAGWEYRYHGHQTPRWAITFDGVADALPNALNIYFPGGRNWLSGFRQRPTLVGSVIRAKPHASSDGGTRPAGSVYSFIAVKEPWPPTTGDDWQVWRSRLSGLWTYRSFHNNATPVYETASPTAHGLILQEAVFKLETPTSTTLQGTIELPGGVLDIDFSSGTHRPAEGGEPPRFEFGGIGRPGTNTAGWEYYFQGHLTRKWSNKASSSGVVDQRSALVGSVMAAPAGYVAPFIAVKR